MLVWINCLKKQSWWSHHCDENNIILVWLCGSAIHAFIHYTVRRLTAKSREASKPRNWIFNESVALKVARHPGRDTAEVSVKFQNGCKSLNPNLAASKTSWDLVERRPSTNRIQAYISVDVVWHIQRLKGQMQFTRDPNLQAYHDESYVAAWVNCVIMSLMVFRDQVKMSGTNWYASALWQKLRLPISITNGHKHKAHWPLINMTTEKVFWIWRSISPWFF